MNRFILALCLVVIFLAALNTPLDPADGWWHLRAGKDLLENGHKVYVDSWSHTAAGAHWISPGEPFQVLMYLVYQAAGFAGLSLLAAVILTATFALLWGQLSGPVWLRAGLLLLAAWASRPVWLVRPALVTLPLLVCVACCLRRRLYWGMAVCLSFWSLLHGAFPIGFGLALAHLADPHIKRWQLGCAIGAAALLVCLNPWGPAMWLYPFQTVGMSASKHFIQEWLSPDFHSLAWWPALLMLVGLVGVGLLQRAPNAPGALKGVLAAVLLLQARRTVGLFALLAAPLLAEAGVQTRVTTLLQERLARRKHGETWAALAVIGLFALVLVAAPDPVQANRQAAAWVRTPTQAVAWLKAHRPAGPLFNRYEHGGYLVWALPEYPVFVDPRANVYGDDFLVNEYDRAVRAAPGWQQILDRRGVNLVLERTDGRLALALGASPDWRLLYQDETAVIYGRTEGL